MAEDKLFTTKINYYTKAPVTMVFIFKKFVIVLKHRKMYLSNEINIQITIRNKLLFIISHITNILLGTGNNFIWMIRLNAIQGDRLRSLSTMRCLRQVDTVLTISLYRPPVARNGI